MTEPPWGEPFFTRTYEPVEHSGTADVRRVLDQMWDGAASAYEGTKSPR